MEAFHLTGHDSEFEHGSSRRGIEAERSRTARLAHNLSVAALHQSEKAVNGMLAMPVAMTLGTAAGMLYVASFVQLGFELVEAAFIEIGFHITHSNRARQDDMMQGQSAQAQYAQAQSAQAQSAQAQSAQAQSAQAQSAAREQQGKEQESKEQQGREQRGKERG